MSAKVQVYMTALGYHLGDSCPISEIKELTIKPEEEILETLLEVGLENYAKTRLSPLEIAKKSIEITLNKASIKSGDIDALVYVTSSFWNPSFSSTKEISRLIYEVDLNNAYPVGVFFSECSSMLTAIRIASNFIKAGEWKNVLVVSSDTISDNDTRIIPPNTSISSDAAASCILTSEREEGFEVLYTTQQIDTAMPDIFTLEDMEEIEQYLKASDQGMKEILDKTMKDMRMNPKDFQKIITMNLNSSVSQTVCKYLDVEIEKIFQDNIPRFAHALASDILINLCDFSSNYATESGNFLLLMAMGTNTWGTSVLCKV
ncbi:MAG: 3-oxoacyl-[acyl-carrier-protein] synthase III C-terminal domain-containing protein [Nostoc sp.]|uniref:3-oxoacyl-[acyl-carrier-protein] synthase III C-terminal domain-containing protein n=1 Tax=Nostoc sp. TaxID=1180 RepID=UPI002FFC05B0